MNCNVICCVKLCNENPKNVFLNTYHDVLDPTSITCKIALEWLLSPSPATLAVASHGELSS